MLAWLAAGLQAFKVPEDNITKNAEEAIAIKRKKRSLNGHKTQLTNQVRMCKFNVGHYRVVRSMEAKETVDRTWQKVLEQQAKGKEVLDELCALDKIEEGSYTKQEKELNEQVDNLAKLIEACKREVAAEFRAEQMGTQPHLGTVEAEVQATPLPKKGGCAEPDTCPLAKKPKKKKRRPKTARTRPAEPFPAEPEPGLSPVVKAEEDAKSKVAEDARLKAETEAKARTQEEEAKLKAKEEAKIRAEAKAKVKAEEEARIKAREEAELKAEEVRLRAEEEAKIKAETKSKAKAEEEDRFKAKEEAEIKAAAQIKLKVEEETKPELRTEPVVPSPEDPESEAEPGSETGPVPVLKPREPEPGSKTEPGLEAEPAVPGPKSEPELRSETELEPEEPEPRSETEPGLEMKPEPGPESEPEPRSKTEPGSEVEPGAGSKSEPEPRPETEPELEIEPEPGPGPEIGSGPESGSKPESEPRLEELQLSKQEEPDSPELGTEDSLRFKAQDETIEVTLESSKNDGGTMLTQMEDKTELGAIGCVTEERQEKRSGLESDPMEAEAKCEPSQKRVQLLSEEKQTLKQDYEAQQVKGQENFQSLRSGVKGWKSEAGQHKGKAMTLESAIESWRNAVVLRKELLAFCVVRTRRMLVDELQAVLDKVAGGIHLQKLEVGMKIPRRKSNDKKKRVTSYEERRLVVKNMENFYRKERWKCFSKWVSRLETGKNCKGQKRDQVGLKGLTTETKLKQVISKVFE